jgi:exopolyphosphatase/guanosine-5'-triphosphate,3'-diphosphate pyrophosphatase
VVAVGTYAFRAAKNGDAVARRITRHAGVPIRVLTGHEEATLSYLSVLMRLRRPKPYTFLIDLGGGSVEFVVAHRGRILRARSLPLGALRLTERHLHSDPITRAQRVIMEREIDVAVSRVIAPFRRVQPTKIDFVASGGTATTAFAMLATHRTSRVSVARVTRAGLEKLADDCFARTLAQRKRLPGLPADRADIIPAGLAVVLAFMQHARKRTLAVSDGGVREGVLLAIDAELEAIAHDRAHQH